MLKFEKLPKLSYNFDSSFIPLNHSDSNLQTIIAEPWFEVDKNGIQLEGVCFDRSGKNLFFVEVFGGSVFKLELDHMKLSKIQEPKGYAVGAVKVHKDGRVFICSMGNLKGQGGVFAVKPDGSDFETILHPDKDFCVDDLAFDNKGGFYFTDFKGVATNPEGGVYYVSPDYKKVTPILQNLAIANGVAMTPDYKNLWVTEVAGNRVLYVELKEDGVTIAPFGASVVCHLTGHLGPDSCCVDEDGNLYIAMYNQGRVLVLNKMGFPIGQIVLPEAAYGHMLRTTSIAFMPESDQVVICSNDGDGGKGSWLYTARGFAEYGRSYQYL